MKARSKVAGIIAAVSLSLLAILPPLRSNNPVEAQSSNVPLFFMQPPEVPLGVQGHPFHAIVTSDWNLSEPGGAKFDTEVKGNVWRDTSGNVRIKGTTTRNGRTTVQLPTTNVVFLAANMTELSWNSETTNARSIRLPNLNYSNHFFESLAVPKAFKNSRFSLYNCRESEVECVTEPLGERVIDGIRVKGTRYKETIPAASLGAANELIVSRDVWSNPEMDIVVEIDGKDPVFGNFEMRLLGISGGEQDKDLFEIPKGYSSKDITPPAGLPDHP